MINPHDLQAWLDVLAWIPILPRSCQPWSPASILSGKRQKMAFEGSHEKRPEISNRYPRRVPSGLLFGHVGVCLGESAGFLGSFSEVLG
jgi:hypothetical protein